MNFVQFNALVKKAKATGKMVNHTVEQNLFIIVSPATSIGTWYAKAKQNNKNLSIRLGSFPDVSLAMAKQLKNEWLKSISVVPDMTMNASYTVRESFNDWYAKKNLQLVHLNI